MIETTYNERSWAIDIISEINQYAQNVKRHIRRAGGERTIRITRNRLFPDVLLFGSENTGIILQGWELKFPDTEITDNELLKNAENKARQLGLNSFLVWNVTAAVLYLKSEEEDIFHPINSWNELRDIKRRDQVEVEKDRWLKLLHTILDDLNDFFEKGSIQPQNFIETLNYNNFLGIINNHIPAVEEYLRLISRKNSEFRANLELWWEQNQFEYISEDNSYKVFSKLLLLNWVNKIVFANFLRRFNSKASLISTLDHSTTINEAIKILENISIECDFYNILKKSLGEQYLNETAWRYIQQLNIFLQELNFSEIEQDYLQRFLEEIILKENRKMAGQFTTPIPIAKLLVRIGLDNIENSVLDPFCGTGTIVKQAYYRKISSGISRKSAIEQIWAIDKFDFPIQVATMALSDPTFINEILYLFKYDSLSISVGDKIEFVRPSDGEVQQIKFPTFSSVISNLPFVRFEKYRRANPNADYINNFIEENLGKSFRLPTKADLLAYIPFYLWGFLENNGKLTIIASNAWLATNWGEKFQKTLLQFYKLKKVVTSGKDRWFHNAQIVTNILVLEKRNEIENGKEDEETSFVTLLRSSESLLNEKVLDSVSSRIILNKENENLRINVITKSRMEFLKEIGLPTSSYFTNLNWLLKVKEHLVPISKYFEIRRGERRGWDAMFYPDKGHGIEADYIKPVLKSPRKINTLTCKPNGEVFCCSLDLNELRVLGHTGAINWIERFSNELNTVGKPLKESLSRSNLNWYEMTTESMADLITSINPDKRIFTAKLLEKAFVNQRFIGYTLRSEVAIDLNYFWAVLNSILGIFYIEALGFGRGLGALDLSSSRLKENLFLLNPDVLSSKDREEIIEAFLPIQNREIMNIEDELNDNNRLNFDILLLKKYNIEEYYEDIKNSFLELYNIRKSVGR